MTTALALYLNAVLKYFYFTWLIQINITLYWGSIQNHLLMNNPYLKNMFFDSSLLVKWFLKEPFSFKDISIGSERGRKSPGCIKHEIHGRVWASALRKWEVSGLNLQRGFSVRPLHQRRVLRRTSLLKEGSGWNHKWFKVAEPS